MKASAAIVGAVSLFVLAGCASAPEVAARPLQIRTGAWEIAARINYSASSKISPDDLAHLPPKVRAEIREAEAENAHAKWSSRTACVTQKDLLTGVFTAWVGAPPDDCVVRSRKANSGHQEAVFQCRAGSGFVPVRVLILDVMNEHSVSGRLESPHSNGIGKGVIDVSGQWMSDDCKPDVR